MEKYLLTQCVFILALVEGHLGCFQPLGLVDAPATDICGHLQFRSHVYTRHLPQRCKAGTPVLRLRMGKPKRDEAVPQHREGLGLLFAARLQGPDTVVSAEVCPLHE